MSFQKVPCRGLSGAHWLRATARGSQHGSHGSHTSYITEDWESAVLRQKPQLASADLRSKNPYLFVTTLCTFNFIGGFQIAFWGKRTGSFYFTWLGQGLTKSHCLFLHISKLNFSARQIYFGKNCSLMRTQRVSTQNLFLAFSLWKLYSFKKTSINTVQLCQLHSEYALFHLFPELDV